MIDVLFTIHRFTGYAVFVVVLVVAVRCFGRARDAREFTSSPSRLALVLLDVQVLVGLVLYGVGGYWEARPEIAYLHPALAVLALGAGHAFVGRARRLQMAAEANRAAGRGLVIAVVLLAAAIGVASAPAFL